MDYLTTDQIYYSPSRVNNDPVPLRMGFISRRLLNFILHRRSHGRWPAFYLDITLKDGLSFSKDFAAYLTSPGRGSILLAKLDEE